MISTSFIRMIKTGDWTIAELVKYLVAVQSTLTPTETDRLRATAAFTKEEAENTTDIKKARYKASDLYEPSDAFRQLGLPIIAWGQHPKWRTNSEEGEFNPCLMIFIGSCFASEVSVRSRLATLPCTASHSRPCR